MDAHDGPARRFQADRGRLRALAHRMLGSLDEAEDAVQEAWLRLERAGGDGIDNLSGWLTTVVSRICLDMLRSRAARREEPYGQEVPERAGSGSPGSPESPASPASPEDQAVLADSVGLALLVVLDRLGPAERSRFAAVALVGGDVGLVVAPRGRLLFALTVTVEGGRIASYDVVAEPARLRRVELGVGNCSPRSTYEVELARSGDRLLAGLRSPGPIGLTWSCDLGHRVRRQRTGPLLHQRMVQGLPAAPGRTCLARSHRELASRARTTHRMRVAAPGSSTPGTSSPKTVRGARLNGLTPAQSTGTVLDPPGRFSSPSPTR
ncbi:sigma factor [Streptomyces canus]|uniref:sigma factor n=1 Tax=Streptomyces canus TaxID=58343 RepID=UPI002781018B|nr:sigma factor [Streptomyces canus]MDQ1065631.1 DNA-directed RNA polymerase specialized sigma24 family protein [Streptomyces canus]